jgi:hypothetical protein
LVNSVTPIPRQCSADLAERPEGTFTSIGTIISQMLPVLARYRAARTAPPLTDPDLVAKRLALIETCVDAIRSRLP